MNMNKDLWKYVLLAACAFIAFKLFMSKESMENVNEDSLLLKEKETLSYKGDAAPSVQFSPSLDYDDNNEQQTLDAEELLPKYNEADEFAKENPVSKLLKEQNFLIAGYHTGVNTVMQSNKIPYHDLRSAPPIAKQQIGPWMQSSYEQPAGGPGSRRFFEVGSW